MFRVVYELMHCREEEGRLRGNGLFDFRKGGVASIGTVPIGVVLPGMASAQHDRRPFWQLRLLGGKGKLPLLGN